MVLAAMPEALTGNFSPTEKLFATSEDFFSHLHNFTNTIMCVMRPRCGSCPATGAAQLKTSLIKRKTPELVAPASSNLQPIAAVRVPFSQDSNHFFPVLQA